MIKQIEITNFRGIKHLVITLNEMTSILTGANNIGKSTVLNAISWFLTNKLLTDKWGVGENDLDSIIPKDAVKGEHTIVTIVADSGATFSKYYKTGYDRTTGLPNKHTTEYKVNGNAYDNATEWQYQLFREMNFAPKLKCKKDVDELRLFTDPLYALQKLDAKCLRELLVDLGCSVSNEEVFAKYPELEVIKGFENQYLGDYTKMRQSLKQERLELIKQLDALELTIEGYKDVEEYNPETKDKLEAQRDELTAKIRSLRKGDSNLTQELELKIQQVKADKEIYITKIKAENSQNLAVLNEKLKLAQSKANEAKNKELSELNEKVRNLYSTKVSIETTIKAYETTRETKRNEVLDCKKQAEQFEESIKKNNERIEEISKRQFVGYVTCPDCGKVFAPDEAALILFNKQKQDDLEHLASENSRLEIQIKEKQKAFELALTLGRNAKAEQEKATHELEELEEQIEDLNNKILAASTKEIDYTQVNEIKAEIDATTKEIDTTKYDVELDELNSKMNDLLEASAQANALEIEKLENQLTPIKEEIELEYMNMSKWNSKLEFQEKYTKVTRTLNTTESLLELVNTFIQKRISMINAKAKEITGLDFVMLENNLTNDSVKEVCYATVDGVEFGNVNTSQKLIVGIQFIHRIKSILGQNKLPILADRMEGFDDINKIKNLTTEQMICTVVGSKDQKEIVII